MPKTTTHVSITGNDRGVQLKSLSDQMSVYTDPDRVEICFEIDGNVTELGYDDPTVSRPTDDLPPVQLVKRGSVVELSNQDNCSKIIVEQMGKPSRKVSTGETITLRSDCYIEPGLNTHFMLSFHEQIQPFPKIRILSDAMVDICSHSPSEAKEYARQLKETIERNPPEGEDPAEYIELLKIRIQSINDGTDSENMVNELDKLRTDIVNLYEDSNL
jgi:hypothetical protein